MMVENVQHSRSTGWIAWIFVGALLLLILGGVHLGVGLIGLIKPELLEGSRADLALPWSLTAVSWLHIVFGAAFWAAGAGLLRGQMWGRVVTIVLGCIGAIINFVFIAEYPVYGGIALALTAVILYAVLVHGGEVAEALGKR
jgi:hypothetical protein